MSSNNRNRKFEVDYEVLVSLLEDSIELMPDEEKDAYLQAVSNCPQLVKTESNPLDFLRFEDNDILKAAKRLMKYWEWRVDLFKERAFLPLFDLSGSGALDEDLLGLLKTGLAVNLPQDCNGDLVLLVDRRRAGETYWEYDHQGAMAHCFWMAEFARHKIKQGNSNCGLVILNRIQSVPPSIVSKKNWVSLVKEGIPLKLKAIRFLILSEKSEHKTWLQAFFPSLKVAILKKVGTFSEATIHSYSSKIDMKLELLSFGLRENGLPPSLGGTWSYDMFDYELAQLERVSGVCAAISSQGDTFERWQMYNRSDEIDNFPLDGALSAIPFVDQMSFVNARNVVPDVVNEESFQSKFKMFFQMDDIEAALRLTKLWTLRERLFSDRFLLYMNQLGSGTLAKIDIQTLNTGFLMILPKDRDGNSVLAYDPSKDFGMSFASQRRCLFYMLFLLLRESSAERGNIRLLCHFSHEEAMKKTKKRSFHDILKAFPMRVAFFHAVLDTNGPVDKEYEGAALLKMKTLFGAPTHETIVHKMTRKMDVCDMYLVLSSYGLCDEDVPPFFGGSFSDERFIVWQDEIIGLEAHLRSEENSRLIQQQQIEEASLFTRFRKRVNDMDAQDIYLIGPTDHLKRNQNVFAVYQDP